MKQFVPVAALAVLVALPSAAALIAVFEDNRDREIPSYALDKHTRRGRIAGTGWSEFFNQGTQLDPHAEQPREAEFKQTAWDVLHSERAEPVDANVGTTPKPAPNSPSHLSGQLPLTGEDR